MIYTITSGHKLNKNLGKEPQHANHQFNFHKFTALDTNLFRGWCRRRKTYFWLFSVADKEDEPLENNLPSTPPLKQKDTSEINWKPIKDDYLSFLGSCCLIYTERITTNYCLVKIWGPMSRPIILSNDESDQNETTSKMMLLIIK